MFFRKHTITVHKSVHKAPWFCVTLRQEKYLFPLATCGMTLTFHPHFPWQCTRKIGDNLFCLYGDASLLSNIAPDYLGHTGVENSLRLALKASREIPVSFSQFISICRLIFPPSRGMVFLILMWLINSVHSEVRPLQRSVPVTSPSIRKQGEKPHSSLALGRVFSMLACIWGDFWTWHKLV